MLAEGIETKPIKKPAKKKPQGTKKKAPVDDLEAALANIDSLSLTTPESAKQASGKTKGKKSEPAIALPGLEPGPALPGLAPGPLAKTTGKNKTQKASKSAASKSVLDTLPPIKNAKTSDRPKTKIGTRLQKEADRVAKKDPGFIERMTSVLQLDDTEQKPKVKKPKKGKDAIPSSPESPSQWAAKVVKTTRLDQARPKQGKKRKKVRSERSYKAPINFCQAFH